MWHSHFIAVFVSVQKEEEKKEKKKRRKQPKETKSICEVAYLGNTSSDFAQIWNVEC